MAKTGTRNRVLSFMSNFSNRDAQSSPASATAPPAQNRQESFKYEAPRQDNAREGTATPTGPSTHPYNMDGSSPQPRVQRERAPSSSRPMSMVQTYQPPLMDVSQDTLPELQPIFTFLNSHANKLYQEGYFLKLDDQNTHGRANVDRTWTECFAQLVGTVLSLWDAAELDAAGQDGEVLPKFINLTDASIKMIESLPTRSNDEAPLQNVLSISTAGRNRYLLHFNSHHSLVQWTAGIRLAMFEHATLQEAYTGALIAGKGKSLNNINIIMERAKVKSEDWARVRFGAGTPWRRCWCVITPPNEKIVQRMQKQANKKKSAYDRSGPLVFKGDIKFYDTKKTKKVQPIATITNAYSAFAIYPQSKPLIEASTLVKVEGSITIHSNPPSTTEGFVFVMPEVHPAVSGFEMMLRWLFPVFDTFALYGRPGRLIADTLDPQSLMFAMPKHRRYGYLEILDVSGLIIEQGSATWTEGEWRRKMKELTKKRMTAVENGSRTNSRYSSRRSTRNSFGPSRSRVQFDDGASVRSSPSITWGQSGSEAPNATLPRTDLAPASGTFTPPRQTGMPHQRSVSETHGLDRYHNQSPAPNYDGAYEQAPTPPPHNIGVASGREGSGLRYMSDMAATPERISSEDEQVTAARATPVRELQELQAVTSPEPVSAPPAFSHAPGSMPISKPYHSPELRRANSRMSNATLSQLAGASGVAAAYHAIGDGARDSEEQWRQNVGGHSGDASQRGLLSDANVNEYPADGPDEGLTVAASNQRFSFEDSSRPQEFVSHSAYSQPPAELRPNSSTTVSVNVRPSMPPFPSSHAPPTRTYEPPNIFASPETHAQNPPSSLGHNPQHSTDSTSSNTSQPPRLQTSQSITRKPLPARPVALQTPTSAETPSSTGSLAHHVIDQAAFDMIGQNLGRSDTLAPNSLIQREKSVSLYEDNASTTSPDYASTRPSIDTQRSQLSKKSLEKPRAGTKKTVGNADPTSQFDNGNNIRSSIHIDFGPTINYAAERIPNHRGPDGRQSPGPAQSYGGDRPRYGSPSRGISPGPGMNNYPVDRPTRRPDSAGHSKSPNRNSITPDNAHYRNESAESRTVAWQPGLAITGNPPSNQQGITPEQFVQQRAAAVPLYAHQRQQSSNTLGRNTPTPPLVRNRSSELLNPQGHSRNNSADLLQRPNSRSAMTALAPAGSGDIASKLSAREQEHIARVTGQPLINMAQNNNRPVASGGGLVGAIQAREHEKQQIKQGINSQSVQQAIAQRQQQAMYQQYPGQGQANYRASQSQYTMGQYPQAQFQNQLQGQQSYVSPAANVYAQGGGWMTPSPGYVTTPTQGKPSPSQYPPQQQYFPPQQQGGQGFGW
ncbi:hypothetical protein G7Y89_g2635 [Cudoniella acicularis]|uniref:PH domain-containing protein n=1 Tax=Cudoniella acicularis TaxID=354080 RepID=A0A8H4RSY8_9HELO|nr:hypothetical protein G7Y89_g2635 [Cudoniella acicularis]